MEPFEDFEFKPLTDGLGFHKKAEKLKTEPSVMRAAFDDDDFSSASKPGSKSPSGYGAKTSGHHSALANDDDFSSEFAMESEAPSIKTPSRSSLSSSSGSSQSISDLIASLPPSLDFIASPKSENKFESGSLSLQKDLQKDSSTISRPQIFQPLAREDYKASSGPTIGQLMPTPGTKASTNNLGMNSPLMPPPSTLRGPTATPSAAVPASQYRERLDESFARAFPHADRKADKRKIAPLDRNKFESTTGEMNLVPIPAHFGAAILDGMVVSGMATLLLVCILAITHVNLMGLLNNAETDGPTRIHLVLLVVAVMQLYMLTARSFFTVSLGEWAFELQLGNKAQHESTLYPLRVAARTLLITVTGFIFLPLISLALNKDLAKNLTGLQLYRQNDR